MDVHGLSRCARENVMLEMSTRNRLGKCPPTGPEFLVVVLVGCREVEILCMTTHAVDEFLDVGLRRDRVHHEAVLGSVSRQRVEVVLERSVLLVRLLKDDCDVSRVEFES